MVAVIFLPLKVAELGHLLLHIYQSQQFLRNFKQIMQLLSKLSF